MSNRITKQMAQNAADELTEKAYAGREEEAKKRYQDLALKLYEKYIPKNVREVFENYPSLYEERSCVRFTTDGASSWDYLSIYIEDATFPPITPILLSKEDWKAIKKANDAINQVRQDRNDFNIECSQALLNLRTEKNIKEHFPEALPYLTFSSCTAIAPCLDNLRMKLK